MELSKRVRCAFVSDSLDEFLERRAELRVSQLSQLNPNIVPLPEGKGVLSLTVLEKRLTKATGAGRNPRQVDPATGLRGPQATTGGRYGNARAMAIAGRALAAQVSASQAPAATVNSFRRTGLGAIDWRSSSLAERPHSWCGGALYQSK